MGTFLKRGNYYIDYYVSGRRKREMIGTSKKLAETVLAKRKVEISENKYLDRRKEEKIKFEDFAETFLQLHSKVNKRQSSYLRDIVLIKNLNKFFSGRYLYAITPQQVEEYKMKRAEECKPATTNREIAVLKCIYNKAILWGKTSTNPAKGVKLFKENNKLVRYLEKEEIEKLLRTIDRLCLMLPGKYQHLKPIISTALHTGLRRSEILSLKWTDVDIIRRVLYIRNSKTGSREVPMSAVVASTLIAIPKHPDSPYIFCGKNGKPFYNVRKSFDTALRECGILNASFHTLRHTFASWCVMSGISLQTVSKLLGHSTLEMTERYSHLSPNHMQRAVDILSRRMDTTWTPEPISDEIDKELISITVDNVIR